MRNTYITLNLELSAPENLKEIANQAFRKEISFDVLRGKPPNYDDLQINGIKFLFVNKNKYETPEIKHCVYLQIFFYDSNKRKHNFIRKSSKIDEQQRINTS